MNAITNVRMNQINNNKMNYSKSNVNSLQSNNVQFKGLNFRKIVTSKAKRQFLSDQKENISLLLNKPYETISNATKDVNEKRIYFLKSLSNAFNSRCNLENGRAIRENGDIVLDIFNSVKKPHRAHFYISQRFNGTMEDMKNVLKLMGNNKQRCDLACRVNEQIVLRSYRHKAAPNLITDILSSKHVDTYAKNFAEYKPYLVENRTNKDAIKNLDKMVSEGTFNSAEYNKGYSIRRLFNPNMLVETEILNPRTIEANYTREGQEFLSAFVDSFGVTENSIKAGNDKDIMEMFKSTTKKNLPLRKFILNEYAGMYQFANRTHNENNKNISELRKLFDNLDKNKHASNFVSKLIDNNYIPGKIESLNEILENVPNKELDIFFDNVPNILNQTKFGENRIETLKKHIKNPFYKTERTRVNNHHMRKIGMPVKKDSIPNKVGKFIKNQFNIIRYKLTGGAEPALTTENNVANAIKETITPQTNTVSVITKTMEPEISEKVITDTAPEVSKVVKTIVNNTEKAAGPEKTIKISRTAPKVPNAKKLEIINDVNSIIEKKLGYKTLAEQKRDYAIKATKMRMQMLPEIFESIKETRAAERTAGKKLSVSNKDAVDLYSLIKGRNKKLINYMLKKRNADGTRMYNIKDIIKTVEQAETKVNKDKFASPKTYKAADAKAYYNTLLEVQIQEHGKLEKAKRKK